MPSLSDGTILLVRHAHVEMAGRFCGHTDPPLSAEGRNQLPELCERLSGYPVTQIFSSDLLRARETASFIANQSNLPVELIPGLREIGFGHWEGLNWDEVVARDSAYAERWMASYPHLPAPGGEDFSAFRVRVRQAMLEISARLSLGCAVVVTHGGVIRTAMLDVLGLSEEALASVECAYASCKEIRLAGSRWQLAK